MNAKLKRPIHEHAIRRNTIETSKPKKTQINPTSSNGQESGPNSTLLSWQALTYYIVSIRKIVHVVEELYDPARTHACSSIGNPLWLRCG
jgi:hypothetical protein